MAVRQGSEGVEWQWGLSLESVVWLEHSFGGGSVSMSPIHDAELGESVDREEARSEHCPCAH